MDITILGIESSCDDTSAAVIRNTTLLSNVIASQAVHMKYGGVIPELASRAHQQNIVPVVDTALKEAGVAPDELDAIAFTRGPGLLGSLLVGVSFAKGLALAHDIPMVEVNHLQGHILSHFLDLPDRTLPHPDFPFLCLLVSGGHTQIVRVDSPLEMEIVGTTIDDAAGEAFDKCAKVMGLGYPGGPVIDRLAREGDPEAFRFAHPHVDGFDFSFSGLKTSFLYTLRDAVADDPDFIDRQGRPLRLAATYDRRDTAQTARPRGQGVRHPRHRRRRRRLGQFGPAQRRSRRGPPTGLAHLRAGVPLHDRQRRDDRRGGLLPLPPRRLLLARRVARGAHRGADVTPPSGLPDGFRRPCGSRIRSRKQTSSDDENEESPALQQRKRTFFRKFHLTFYYLCRK